MPLNPANVAPEVAPLLPMAERWGLPEDGERYNAVTSASTAELRELIGCLDSEKGHTLFDWLSGAGMPEGEPSDEYFALSCLTMAFALAKIVLARRLEKLQQE